MAMNYVGKLLSNFKGFYNEINSATLTGAIDVIIVQQEDGTYLSSPWHVRFGKMGVLRAREKVVDIEINDQPVDLQMKLGEAGEAFFIQEAEETGEMPAHLATSPLPDSLELMEEGLRELRQEGSRQMTDSQTNTDLDLQQTAPSIVSVVSDDALIQGNHSNQYFSTVSVVVETDTNTTNHDNKNSPGASVRGDSKERTAIQVTIDSVANGNNKMANDMATQTDMTGREAETISKTRSSANLQSLVPSGSDELPPLVVVDKKSSSSVEPAGQRQRRRRRRRHRSSELRKESGNRLEVVSTSTGSGSSAEFQEEAIFDLDLEDEEIDPSLAIQMNTMGRTVSMPMIDAKNRRVDEWANNQYASHLHPFSDGDITPIVSPVGSRPPSPKSDTELDRDHNMDAMSQTQLTGDDMQPIDTLTWHWGEIPELSPRPSHQQQQTSTSTALGTKDEKPSSGLFHFMRQTKKIRHQPEQGGIYLDDLNLEQMDPEVAALYLYNKQSSTQSGVMRTLQDEDTESGRGASLPQSPITVQKEPHELEAQHRGFPFLPEVTMSLCGGLKDVEIEHCPDNFSQFLVTYDDFCGNPAVLSNPSLVIRIGDKFYNWQIASPIIMSALVFQQPLSEIVVEQLIQAHLPKKERRRGWFSWVRSGGPPGDKKAADGTSPPSSAASSTPNSPKKKKDKKDKPRIHRIKDGFETDEESDGSSSRSGQNEQPGQSQTEARGQDEVAAKAGHQDSVTQTRKDFYKKTLKLSSEEIEKLGLKSGENEASFSVTTQYQGTSRCNCFIYVWRWDDKIIVSDIDGTITKSDVLGQVFPLIGKDWSQAGVANLYQFIHRNGYRFLYLSARAIGQSKITRDYLKGIRQGDLRLPDGPLLLSPSSLISAFHREVIERKPEEFKIGCLRDIAALFPKNPLYAGFGNKINDVWAYRAVDIPSTRIFTVNPKGELKAENNLNFMSSYTKLGDIADHFFPALQHSDRGKIHVGNFPGSDQYSTFTYWREPLPDIDLEITSVLKGTAGGPHK